MSDDLQRGVQADGEAIEKAMQKCKPDWTWTNLIEEAKISHDTLNRARRGVPVDKRTVSRIALALGVTYDSLLKREERTYKVPGKTIEKWTDEDWLALRAQIQAKVPPGDVVLKNTEDGCVKITISVTSEQAEVLDRLQAEGKLSELGLAAVAERPAQTLWKRINYGRIASWASLACSLSMLFPVYAPRFYIAGLVLSAVGIAFARKRMSGLILPAIALLLNGGGLLAWPKAVGFYKNNGGFELRYGDRSPVVLMPVKEQRTIRVIDVALIRKQMEAVPYRKGDIFRVTQDGKLVVERSITAEDVESPDDITVEYNSGGGKHHVSVAVNETQLFAGEIDTDNANAQTVLFKDLNLSITLTAKK